MAETDVSHEFGREPGFSSLVFDPEHSHMLHLLLFFWFATSKHFLATSSKNILLDVGDEEINLAASVT